MTPSPSSWILLARIVRPQGRRGELLADIFTDFPERFAERDGLFIGPPGGQHSGTLQAAKVEAQWLHKGRVVLKFSGVDSIEEAEKLRGFEVVIPSEARLPLEADAVYVSDLLGMRVMDVSGGGTEDAGEIVDVEPEGASPAMLVLRNLAGDELLIPFVRAYLRKVDIAGKRLEMELPAGLLSLQVPMTAAERLIKTDEAE